MKTIRKKTPAKKFPAKRATRPRYPHALLLLGAVILLAGGVLLLGTLGYLPQPGPLWPVPVMLAGLALLYLAYAWSWRERWIIPGMVLSLGGIVVLLLNTVLREEGLARIWPAFMLVTGLSLIPYGYKKRGSARIAIVVPAVFISALAVLFFFFSLRAGGGFAAFVRQWWPMILVILGLALLVSFFSSRRPSSKV
jgi:hypothetical protein